MLIVQAFLLELLKLNDTFEAKSRDACDARLDNAKLWKPKLSGRRSAIGNFHMARNFALDACISILCVNFDRRISDIKSKTLDI